MVNICYILNDNYIDLLQYSLKTLIDTTNSNNEYIMYIVSDHISLPHQRQLQSLKQNNIDVSIVNANNMLPESYDKFGKKKSAALKLYLHKLLNIDKVLYLDCDTVIKQDIAKLYDIDFGNNVLCACPDDICYTNANDYTNSWIYNNVSTQAYKEVKEEIILKRNKTYVNSGVLLIDLKKLRETGLGDQLIDYRLNHTTYFEENNPSMDQDTINLILSDHIKILPLIYNYFARYDKDYTLEQLKISADDIVIKHNAYPNTKNEIIEWMSKETGYTLLKTKVKLDFIKEFAFHYNSAHGNLPNLAKPMNLSELWMSEYLKQNSFKDIYDLADRIKVRDYVKQKGLECILPKLYGIYDNAEDIDFQNLPKKFALKCSLGNSMNLICTDKNTININEWKEIAEGWLHRARYNPFIWEEHYNVGKPKLIIEEYIEPSIGHYIPEGYDILCRYGKPFAAISWTLKNGEEHLSRAWYDMPWVFRADYLKDEVKPVDKPKHYDELIDIAKKLSEDLPFVRIDLYQSNDKIYFGEVTLTSDAMFFESVTNECLNNLGEKIRQL